MLGKSRKAGLLLKAGFLVLTFVGINSSWAGVLDEPKAHPAIPLLDESGSHVLDSGKPYSPRMSCGTGGCHDYDAITHAFHFEQGSDEARDDFGAERGLPQLVSPGYYGGYNCMGSNNPDILAKKENATESDFADHGSAGLVKRCISCHSGGGWMEKDRNGRRYDEVDPTTVTALDGDYFNRSTDADGNSVITQWDWQKSGVVENDCLMCHARYVDLKSFDARLPAGEAPLDMFKDVRRHALIDNDHFRYADSAILEFLNINMDGNPANDKALLQFARVDDDADGAVAVDAIPVDANGEPVITWNAAAFDGDRKAVIPMARYPANDACMQCHRTANSRRGFYGFGDNATLVYDENDLLVRDYQDDVHKGLDWTEANGEIREIQNCNACHTRNYYNPSHSNVDLDADHSFLKGNSDMDVANERDYTPSAKSCVYCHDDAETPAIPSGHPDMLSAHRERWKLAGDMAGYTEDSLTSITQTHLDVVTCEACHITDKASRGTSLQIMYRYAASEDGKVRLRPYNARYRYYWKDKTSGYVFSQTERNSAFRMETDANGDQYGAVIDPVSGAELGQVAVRLSHGSWRFGDPADYDTMMAVKGAYDAVLRGKGLENPDAVLVWRASNFFVMSHNTRPAVEAAQCEDCHTQTARGAFSSLISNDGILSESNIKTVTTVVDKRLVDEGVIVFDFPSMKVDANGVVTENVSDILYSSGINPSLSRLNSAIAPVISGMVQKIVSDTALAGIGLAEGDIAPLQLLMPTGEIYLFQPSNCEPAVRQVAIMSEDSLQAGVVLPTYRFLVGMGSDELATAAAQATNRQTYMVYRLEATDSGGNPVIQFPGTPLYVKLPWSGTDVDQVSIVTSSDGVAWSQVDPASIVLVRPQTAAEDGYVVMRTDHFSYYAVTDAVARDTVDSTSISSSGGGSVFYLPVVLLLLLSGRLLQRRKTARI
ncbi:MAG: cytochrome C [endosymbiont of Seepiophila jonesi]|uniref:Cytochrome C n=1 Tax=endosymbiont of Lamellibrachia luymesi TaxID=2200907 RepID=A0A370DQV3_9GAMM|nr:MAG: cytochrome C [endosymbiont of Lamellibrachia luymesi]RDH93865.1 MAG: cytochrome C [endosymbiont of Seepiophila jonesi]